MSALGGFGLFLISSPWERRPRPPSLTVLLKDDSVGLDCAGGSVDGGESQKGPEGQGRVGVTVSLSCRDDWLKNFWEALSGSFVLSRASLYSLLPPNL